MPVVCMCARCEERRDLEQAVTHYESVLKMDEQHKEAVELLRGCRQLMVGMNKSCRCVALWVVATVEKKKNKKKDC